MNPLCQHPVGLEHVCLALSVFSFLIVAALCHLLYVRLHRDETEREEVRRLVDKDALLLSVCLDTVWLDP